MRESQRVEQQIAALQNFRERYRAFVNQVESGAGVDEVWAEEVDMAAGSVVACGAPLYLTGYAGHTPRNPIVEWRESFDGGGIHSQADVLGATDLALGSLRQMLEVTRRQERTFAGRVARVFGFPAEVRRIAGTNSKVTGQVAFWGTIVAPIIVAVVAGLVLAAILGKA